jgi:hypothetical protein
MIEQQTNVYVMNCHFCGEHNGCSYPQGKDCFIGGEPGWIITCDRCFKTTAYRSSEVRPLQFSWGPA